MTNHSAFTTPTMEYQSYGSTLSAPAFDGTVLVKQEPEDVPESPVEDHSIDGSDRLETDIPVNITPTITNQPPVEDHSTDGPDRLETDIPMNITPTITNQPEQTTNGAQAAKIGSNQLVEVPGEIDYDIVKTEGM